MKIDASTAKIFGVLAIALVGVYVLGRIKNISKDVGAAPVNVVTGAVEAVAEVVGITPTDEDKCEMYIKAGDKWNASFACGAPRYISALWRGEFGDAQN